MVAPRWADWRRTMDAATLGKRRAIDGCRYAWLAEDDRWVPPRWDDGGRTMGPATLGRRRMIDGCATLGRRRVLEGCATLGRRASDDGCCQAWSTEDDRWMPPRWIDGRRTIGAVTLGRIKFGNGCGQDEQWNEVFFLSLRCRTWSPGMPPRGADAVPMTMPDT